MVIGICLRQKVPAAPISPRSGTLFNIGDNTLLGNDNINPEYAAAVNSYPTSASVIIITVAYLQVIQ